MTVGLTSASASAAATVQQKGALSTPAYMTRISEGAADYFKGQHPRWREMLMTPEPWRIQIGLLVSISVLHVLQSPQTYLFWRGAQGDSFGSAYVNDSPRGFLGVDR